MGLIAIYELQPTYILKKHTNLIHDSDQGFTRRSHFSNIGCGSKKDTS